LIKAIGSFPPIPALFTQPSISGSDLTNCSSAEPSVKSNFICSCPAPSNKLKTSFKRCSSLPTNISLAPNLAHSIAVAFPIPEEAPVIKMVLPTKEKGLYIFQFAFEDTISNTLSCYDVITF